MTELEHLYRSLGGDLRRYLMAQLHDADLVEDVVQDTFLRVQLKRHQLKTDGRVAPWLFRIAKHAAMDRLRERQRREELPQELQAEEPPAEFMNQALGSWLTATLQELKPEYREALELTELQGMSQVEVARKLGLSPSGARTRVQRARRELEDKLHECCRVEVDARGNVLDCAPNAKDCLC